MCGIVGAIAHRDVVPLLVDGLKRLEYRGYDSAGIAVIDGDAVRRVRRTGGATEMEGAAPGEGVGARVGLTTDRIHLPCCSWRHRGAHHRPCNPQVVGAWMPPTAVPAPMPLM